MQSVIIFKTIHKKMTASIHSILITSLWTFYGYLKKKKEAKKLNVEANKNELFSKNFSKQQSDSSF